MMRAFLLIIAALARLAAGEAETVAAPAATAPHPAGYQFRVGDGASRWYVYECKQEVAQETAGETLHYTTALRWTFVLTPTAVAEHQATLAVTITRIQARHRGPEGEHLVDSTPEAGTDEPQGGDDKLLGHLVALCGVTLTLTMDPTTGVVSAVAGGDKIIAAIVKREPSAFSGQASPLEAEARSLYSSESLARWWSEALLPPATGTQKLPPIPPLDLALERRWKGDRYDLALPEDAAGKPIELLHDPTPLTARVAKLAGSGRSTIEDGYPGEGGGDVTLTFAFEALTQPVNQTTHLVWRRARLEKP